MKTFSAIAFAVATLAVSASAQATVYDVTFNGLVQSQIGTTVALNSPVSGEFIYDTALSSYTKFTIDGQSVAAGFASLGDLSPDNYTALYTAQLSPVSTGGAVNSTFSLDLEGTAPWTAPTVWALLTSSQLPGNLDPTSSFTYYMGNSSGSNVQTLTATLTGLQVSAVPEPATLALLLGGVAVVGAAARRRQAA